MKNRVIAAGLCICMVIGISGCGKKAPDASDYAVSRSQEAAREEVRRHLDQENSEGPKDGRASGEEESGRGSSDEKENGRDDSGKKTEGSEKNEKKSELARAAAEEAHRRAESSEQYEYGDSKRREDEDSHSGERKSDGTFQVDCICFELPEGWEKDEYLSDSYDMAYAPGGDADTAMDCLIVSRVSEAFGMIDMFLENIDEMENMLEEEIAEEEEEYHVTIEDIGMTFLGHTLKMKAFVRDEEESGVIVLYFAEDDTNLYSLYAYTLFEEGEDIGADAGLSVQMEEALRMFFDTGRVENRKL